MRHIPVVKHYSLPFKEDADTSWWRHGFHVAMAISVIAISIDAKPGEAWEVHGFDFKLRQFDVRAHNDCIEEQLWAQSLGLA